MTDVSSAIESSVCTLSKESFFLRIKMVIYGGGGVHMSNPRGLASQLPEPDKL